MLRLDHSLGPAHGREVFAETYLDAAEIPADFSLVLPHHPAVQPVLPPASRYSLKSSGFGASGSPSASIRRVESSIPFASLSSRRILTGHEGSRHSLRIVNTKVVLRRS